MNIEEGPVSFTPADFSHSPFGMVLGPNEPPRSDGDESKNQSWSVANGLVFAEASGLITIAKITSGGWIIFNQRFVVWPLYKEYNVVEIDLI